MGVPSGDGKCGSCYNPYNHDEYIKKNCYVPEYKMYPATLDIM